MPFKRLLFRSAACEKILRGATQLADAIWITLGPKSKSVLIKKQWGVPIVCNDGVAIAKELSLEDAEENLGAQMLRPAAEKTGDALGVVVEELKKLSKPVKTRKEKVQVAIISAHNDESIGELVAEAMERAFYCSPRQP